MAHCELTGTCKYFDRRTRSSHRAYIDTFCNQDNYLCARYLIACSLGRDAVPDDLRPEDKQQAFTLMRARAGTPRDIAAGTTG